ncbi:hypothetical protein B5F40_03705 [Gordonibacter sp. An230]|uniref:hypothetical protein n=1 Tax=Gordonibacter sp. An230 TaxID=1965592 RepID=UPI000B36F21A|nr:hypothetical protein [Gordonibacter sp. An230]OUO91547.1 hypothetical protein B5F40_03705 [Gordonibacter sp. An230]
MLRVSKRHLFLFYALSIMGSVAMMAATALALGGGVPAVWWGYLLVAFDIAVPVLLASRTAKALLSRSAVGRVKLYDEGCDPSSFIDRSAEVEQRARPPFDGWTAWYMSRLGLAYCDLGDLRKARSILSEILGSANGEGREGERAEIALVSYDLAAKLMGGDAASSLLDSASLHYERAPGEHGSELKYIGFQRKLRRLSEEGDVAELSRLLRTVWKNDGETMRTRVEAAFRESETLRFSGRESLEALRFAAENGGSLLAARKARARLEEMAGRGRP